MKNDFLPLFIASDLAARFDDAAKAIRTQAEAEKQNDQTARVFAEQRPARNIEQERGYRAKLDEIHAQAVELLRARGR